MTEKQLFRVLVRAIGILVFMQGIGSLYVGCVRWAFAGFERPLVNGLTTLDLMYASVVLAVGATMVRWPDWVVRLAWLEKLPTIGHMPDDDKGG